MNNLIIHGSFGQGIPVDANSPKRKRTRRSFISVERKDGNVYQYRKRIGPESMELPTNDAHKLLLDECNKHNFFWALMRFKDVEKKLDRFPNTYAEPDSCIDNVCWLPRLHQCVCSRNIYNLSGKYHCIMVHQ